MSFDNPPTYPATVSAQISWVQLFSYDNTDNSGTITDQVSIETTETLDFSTYEETFNSTVRKDLIDSKVGAEVGASYEGISAKVTSSLEVSSEVTDTLQQTTKSTFAKSYSKKMTHTRTVLVGPHSKSTLYQQVFTAPGIYVLGSTVRSDAPPVENVTIQYLVQPIRFVKGLQVVYGGSPSDAPAVRVREYHNDNDDINAGYGGKYVWLVPIYTYNATEATTVFDLFIQGDGHDGWLDLAAGAGGSYRFLIPAPDPDNRTKITDLALWRSGDGTITFPAKYTGHTSDINANRKDTYLYLMWSTRNAF